MVLKDYWIDPEELAQLGAELSDESGQRISNNNKEPLVDLFGDAIQPLAGPVDGDDFPQLDLEKIGEQLAAIKQRAQNSGLLRSSGSREMSEPDFIDSVAGTTLVDRLEYFVKWAYSQDLLTGIFITDMSGKELVDSGADPVIVNSGIELAAEKFQEQREMQHMVTEGVSTMTNVRDWEGSVLTIFCCRSSYGEHVLGTLSTMPLSTGLTLGLRKGFGRVMGSN